MTDAATGDADAHERLAARDGAHLIHPVTAPRELAAEGGPRVVVAAEGVHVTDDLGRRILDGFAGLWCVAVGHGRPEIIDAVADQLRELDYFTTFHGQSHPRAIELAERLASMFPPAYGLNHVMFSSGGSEANETNFKLARLYWALRGEERRTGIVARHHGYHGLTIATMTATGILPMHWGFGPEAAGFAHIPAPTCYRCELGLEYPSCGLACARTLESHLEEVGPETVAAFIAEPVIGAGGIIPPPPDYFATIRDICDRYGILLIVDEVVTGFGRTGTMFGFERYGVRPDIVTLAKGLTSGYQPLGASVVSDQVWDTIAAGLPDQMPLSHGFTYSGHPACCAAALANLDLIERDDLVANAAEVGAYLQEQLHAHLDRFDTVGDIRGVGLMAGIELVADKATKRGFSRPHTACVHVEHGAWERGLYCRAMGIEVAGLAPPLTVTRGDVDTMVAILAESIAAMEADLLPRERQRAARPRTRHPDVAAVFASMPGRFDAAKAAEVALTVAFALTGPDGGRWTVRVDHGRLAVDGPAPVPAGGGGDDPADDADVTIRATAADYLAMVNGDLSGAEAFGTQRLVIDGDLNQAALLGGLGLM